jgi:hypothetical protein
LPSEPLASPQTIGTEQAHKLSLTAEKQLAMEMQKRILAFTTDEALNPTLKGPAEIKIGVKHMVMKLNTKNAESSMPL